MNFISCSFSFVRVVTTYVSAFHLPTFSYTQPLFYVLVAFLKKKVGFNIGIPWLLTLGGGGVNSTMGIRISGASILPPVKRRFFIFSVFTTLR